MGLLYIMKGDRLIRWDISYKPDPGTWPGRLDTAHVKAGEKMEVKLSEFASIVHIAILIWTLFGQSEIARTSPRAEAT